jgi:hypothetical protein
MKRLRLIGSASVRKDVVLTNKSSIRNEDWYMCIIYLCVFVGHFRW